MKYLGALLLSSAATVLAGPLILDDGRQVRLGESVAAVEARFDEKAFAAGRPGIDQAVAMASVRFAFDTGKLWRVTFGPGSYFMHPLAPFDADWKNLTPIGTYAIKAALSSDDFAAYLAAWIHRAEEAGKREGVDYWIVRTGSPQSGNKVSVVLAPRRRVVGTGTLTGDTWSFGFAGEAGHKYKSETAVGSLIEVAVANDEFRTLQRGAPLPLQMPSPATAYNGVTLEDGTHLYFGQSKAEVETVVGVVATTPSSQINSRGEIDQLIALRDISVSFDSNLLARIMYRRFTAGPAPFPEQWKNLGSIGALKVSPAMSKEAFMHYLAAWEKRALAAGKQRGPHFRIRETTSGSSEWVNLSMAPSRPGARGALWPDAWNVQFAAQAAPDTEMVLKALEASRGEFNSRPPTLAAQRKTAVHEMAAERARLEMPKFDVTLPVP